MRRELGHWKRVLFEAPWIGLLLLALLGGLAAYQVQRPDSIDVGGTYDGPYLREFHDPEEGQAIASRPVSDFRWTRARSEVRLFGVGGQDLEVRLRMQAFRPSGQPPNVSLLVSGVPVASFAVGPDWQVYQVLVSRRLLPAGNLRLELRCETFWPEDDPRDLGVAVDQIDVHPQETDWVRPAWGQLAGLLGATLLAYLPLRRWGLGRGWSSVLTALASGLLVYLLAFHRLSLTCFTTTLVALLAVGCALTALGLPIVERRWGTAPPLPEPATFQVREARLLWAVLLLGFLLRLGGTLYPQFRTSDLIFHVHRLERVLNGRLLFTAGLPDVNLPAPYPPGLYLAMAPGVLIFTDRSLLMKVTGVALDTVAGLLLYFLARRLSGRRDVALVALLLQQAAPLTFLIYSWGIYTNTFSRVALLGVLFLLCREGWEWGRGWVLLAGTCGLVLLGHFADSLLLVAYVLATAALGLLLPAGRRAALRLAVALLVAAVLALALYYTAPSVWQPLREGLRVLMRGQGRPVHLINPLPRFLSHVQAPLALLGLPGLAVLLATRPARRWPWLALGGALLTALVFALGEAIFGFSSRYSLFILPVLALGAGTILASLRWRGWAGRLVVGVLLGYVLWNAVWFWELTVRLAQR